MPPTISAEEQQRRHQKFLHLKDMIIDGNKRATDLGLAALKAVMIINGSGAAGLLAFISQMAKDDRGKAAAPLIGSVRILVAGVAAAALAVMFGYLRMYFESVGYGREIQKDGALYRWVVVANVCLWCAIVLTGLAYVAFIMGMLDGAHTIRSILEAAVGIQPTLG
ncbi:MAG TPA: hypothetical protein VMH36_02480 [Alphaproteobacteria bacterium]|nr:hypothetical protein [Alphaproteobacteria bacterium]